MMRYLADEKQQVGVAGEVHGEEEQGQLLHHRDATFMRQGEGQRLDFWRFFGGAGLGVHGGARPLGRAPQTDQVFDVLEGGASRIKRAEDLDVGCESGWVLTLDVACLSLACSTSSL